MVTADSGIAVKLYYLVLVAGSVFYLVLVVRMHFILSRMGSIEYFIRRNTEDEGKIVWNDSCGQYHSAVGSDSYRTEYQSEQYAGFRPGFWKECV